jgi:hypothetical protein
LRVASRIDRSSCCTLYYVKICQLVKYLLLLDLNRTPTEERLLAAQKSLEQAMSGGQKEKLPRLPERQEDLASVASVTSEQYRRVDRTPHGVPYRSTNETPSRAGGAASTWTSVAAAARGPATALPTRDSTHALEERVEHSHRHYHYTQCP